MLQFAVCDDLQNDRVIIKNYIKDYCILADIDFNILTFDSGEALENHYVNRKVAIDIIFLDIYMGEKNGIATAKQIRKYDSNCKIIFTTSSTEHALESFDVFPFHYLIKPISKNLFNTVFEKALKSTIKEKQKCLSIKSAATIQTVLYKDIIYIESTARTLNIHNSKNKEIIFLSKLDDIQNQLNDRRFVRCHKSFLVNMDYIGSVENNSFHLTNGMQIPITQRNFAYIKNVFYNYILELPN